MKKGILLVLDGAHYYVRLEEHVIELICQKMAEAPPARPGRGSPGIATWLRELICDDLGLDPKEKHDPPLGERIAATAEGQGPLKKFGSGVAGWVRALVYDELGLGDPPDPYVDRRGNSNFGGRGKRGVEAVEGIPGEAIAAARDKAGLSQSQLAQKMGVKTNAVAQYEKRGVKTPATVERVREALAGHL